MNDDYWEKLRHQAAISALQGILSNPKYEDNSYNYYDKTAEYKAVTYADNLIKLLKNEKGNHN